jgi:hypothetical protein
MTSTQMLIAKRKMQNEFATCIQQFALLLIGSGWLGCDQGNDRF